MIEKLLFYLEYPFIQHAFIVAILIALCSALVGISIVLKRMSFLGTSISNIAFGTHTITIALSLSNNFLLVTIATVIMTIILLKNSDTSKNNDALIAILSVSSLSIGYLSLNLTTTSSNITNDVCATLFGSVSVLTLSTFDVWLCILLSVAVIIFFIFNYHQIFSITFDNRFAKVTNTDNNYCNTFLSIITGLVVVLAMNLVGSLLSSALLIFPVLSAMCISKSFKAVSISSIIISVICAILGLCISIYISSPVGPTIVVIHIIIYLLLYLIQWKR